MIKKLIVAALAGVALLAQPVLAAGFPVGANPTPPVYNLLSNQAGSSGVVTNVQGGAYIFEIGIDPGATNGTFGGATANLQIANSATGVYTTVASCTAACTVSVPQVGQASTAKVVLVGGTSSGLTAKLEGVGGGFATSVGITGPLPGFATPPAVTVNNGSIAISNTPTVAQQDMAPVTTASATASGTELFRVDATGYAGVSFQPTGTFVGTITFSGSNDANCATAANFGSIGSFSSGGSGPSTTTTGSSVFVPKLLKCIRGVVTSYTSGTISGSAYLAMQAPVGTSTVTANIGSSGTVGINAGTNTIGNVNRSIFYTETPVLTAGQTTFGVSRANFASGALSTWSSVSCFFSSDQASGTNGAQIQGSNDNFTTKTVVAQQTLSASTPMQITAKVSFQYYRCTLLNGATAPTAVAVALTYSAN